MLPYTPTPLDPALRRASGIVAADLASQMDGQKPRKGLYTLRVPEGSYNLIALYLHHIETGASNDPAASPPAFTPDEYYSILKAVDAAQNDIPPGFEPEDREKKIAQLESIRTRIADYLIDQAEIF